MGWSTYYGLGGWFWESEILEVANAMKSRGLQAAGYDIIWFDYGWASGARDRAGNIIIDGKQWPDGIEGAISKLHGLGFKVGAYADAGATGGSNSGLGLLTHYDTDAKQLTEWGFDALKLDFVGAGEAKLNPRDLYAQFYKELRAVNPSMILACCNFWRPGDLDGTNPSLANSAFTNYQWAPGMYQSWRTDTDIGITRRVWYRDVLRNFTSNMKGIHVSAPGKWSDPDNVCPELGMTADHAQSQMSLWCLSAAPLILGSDPRKLSDATIAMLTNKKVINVDQDPLGKPPICIFTSLIGTEAYYKPLVNGARALVFLNRSPSEKSIVINLKQLALAPGYYWYEDLWTTEQGGSSSELIFKVPANTSRLFLVWR